MSMFDFAMPRGLRGVNTSAAKAEVNGLRQELAELNGLRQELAELNALLRQGLALVQEAKTAAEAEEARRAEAAAAEAANGPEVRKKR